MAEPDSGLTDPPARHHEMTEADCVYAGRETYRVPEPFLVVEPDRARAVSGASRALTPNHE